MIDRRTRARARARARRSRRARQTRRPAGRRRRGPRRRSARGRDGRRKRSGIPPGSPPRHRTRLSGYNGGIESRRALPGDDAGPLRKIGRQLALTVGPKYTGARRGVRRSGDRVRACAGPLSRARNASSPTASARPDPARQRGARRDGAPARSAASCGPRPRAHRCGLGRIGLEPQAGMRSETEALDRA
jgi:hypothetical protein